MYPKSIKAPSDPFGIAFGKLSTVKLGASVQFSIRTPCAFVGSSSEPREKNYENHTNISLAPFQYFSLLRYYSIITFNNLLQLGTIYSVLINYARVFR